MSNRVQYQVSRERGDTIIKIGLEQFHSFRYYRLFFSFIYFIGIIAMMIFIFRILLIGLLFTIPFFVIAIFLIVVNINSFYETQEITICAQQIRLKKLRPILPKSYQIPIHEIKAIKLKQIEMGNNKGLRIEKILTWLKGFKNFNQVPTIITSNNEYYFSEYSYFNDEKNKFIQILKNNIYD
ncbi:hypothetical protein KMW28_10255 [Flammeovirga yaeyamensis]|uniref:YcxB-like protein domain-containing protein n=1 Tax=Flammeovirga yaeyamensis TaxID=367791 RepID=A0AAX1N1W1_9BACT|nr:hypothetical protein [Flammeovirga yaeyamensis]MBB3696465.1 hypothetical protein [Flammeovirga yaeyamensis]NMF35143.1 hypothetical protein [Flammeovirga yaeyamensis]QWG00037.1 hypothetical protein KMW28_10255 [Flammeovirga yaeyamensis]